MCLLWPFGNLPTTSAQTLTPAPRLQVIRLHSGVHPDTQNTDWCWNHLNYAVNTYDPSFYNQLLETGGIFGGAAYHDSIFNNNVYMALIVCAESRFQLHAQNGQYYGWYQQNTADMAAAGISLSYYLNGGVDYGGQWLPNYDWQNWTGAVYISNRYGNSPQAAWNHEVAYGWF
jgi:hypothetical protein